MLKAREAARQRRANALEIRVQRSRANMADTAAFLMARSRIDEVDSWEAKCKAQVLAQAERRREGHHRAAAAALARIRARGETVAAIAALADTNERTVRVYLKMAAAGRGDSAR
jgi:hypothetical protein